MACGPRAAEARTSHEARTGFDQVLVGDECGRLADEDAKGWRALLGADPDDDEDPVSTHIFCPECAAREFGDPRQR